MFYFFKGGFSSKDFLSQDVMKISFELNLLKKKVKHSCTVARPMEAHHKYVVSYEYSCLKS